MMNCRRWPFTCSKNATLIDGTGADPQPHAAVVLWWRINWAGAAVRGDPLADIDALGEPANILLVVKEGTTVSNRGDFAVL